MELAVGKPFSSTENDKVVLDHWSSIGLYEKWINPVSSSSSEPFHFVDGPPFVSSDNLHYGHILISLMKSSVLYYQRMNGKKVSNKLGYDCIAKGTLINLGNGTSIPIENFTEDDVVETYSEELKGIITNKKTMFMDKGLKECIQLEFTDGTKLICTPNHKIMTTEGYLEAEKIIINETNILQTYQNPKLIDFDKETTWSLSAGEIILNCSDTKNKLRSIAFCRALGFMLADGCLFENKSEKKKCLVSYIYLGHEIDAIAYQNDIELICGFKPKFRPVHGLYVLELPRKLVYSFASIPGVPVGKRIRLGKIIPDFIKELDCPLYLKQEFLAGLFGGDGHTSGIKTYPNGNFAMRYCKFSQSKHSSKVTELYEIIMDICNLLEQVGVKGAKPMTLHETSCSKNKNDPENTTFELVLQIPKKSNIDFAEKVGFRYCYNKTFRMGVMSSFLKTQKNNPKVKCKDWLEKSKTLELMKTKYAVLKGQNFIPVYQTQVISKTNVGEHQVYDLTVENTHNFIANGIIVHNCHGLPIEMAVNKLLNINTPKEVTDMGIDKYNQYCKETIYKYSGAWRPVFESIGRMCDWENSYRTMDTNFMESVWWVFKQLHLKGLVYRGTRVMPFSPACNTPLSNFEASQNYKEIDDQSLYVAFQMKTNIEPGVDDYIIAWTTTPWTLPSNLALCVNPTEQYHYIYSAQHNKRFIISSHYVQRVFPDFPNESYVVTHIKTGNELKDLEYFPLFNYRETTEHIFRILCDDFVEISDGGSGSGVVHLAPGFGEEDYRVCQKNGITMVFVPIDENGVFQLNLIDNPNCLDLNGKFYKDCNKEITKNLETRQLVIKKENIKHSYPFCWRTDTPLIYRAMNAWFIQASSLIEDMLKNNEKINWYPGNIGSGRFKNWLENAKDWCVSRNRFFGTPIPIWQNTSDPSDYIVIGSITELSELSGVPAESITDLHMEFTDRITIERDGKTYKRISEVFDCWFESGSVPLAQVHYPFNPETIGMFDDKEALCDFICEGIDQTRGWFYTLHVISTALFNKPAFKNVVCAGLILAKDGKKMSKRLANYTPPMEVIRTFGADALRMYMLSLGATSADSSCFKDDDIRNDTKTLNQWINSVKFLIEHIKMYEGCTGNKFVISNEMEWNDYDLWIMSRLKTTISQIKYWMTTYNFPKITTEIYEFIEDFTNWFLKFNRARLKGKEDTTEKSEWLISLNTCVYVVNTFNVAIAPFTPFLSETIYKNLRDNSISIYSKDSVLLEEYPSDLEGRNEVSERRFKLFQRICDSIRSIRNQVGLASVKTPVKNIKLYSTDDIIVEDLECMREYFNSDEINILQLEIAKQTEMNLEVTIDPRYGKVYRAGLKAIKDYLLSCDQEQLKEIISSEKFTIGDIEVLCSHLVVKYVSSIVLGKNEVESICEVNGKKITVILDKTQDSSVLEKHFMRMVIYHTQKIRKDSGVRPWFKILFFYETSNSELRTLLEKSLEQIGIDLGFPASLEEPKENNGKWANECFSYSIGDKEESIHLTIFKME